MTDSNRYRQGAQLNENGAQFRLWAPAARAVTLVLENPMQRIAMQPEDEGFFRATVADIAAGTLYRYQLDGSDLFPDPCSRYQPLGPHGPSQLIDRDAWRWHDADWHGIDIEGQIIYEMHIGTFTAAGTFDAAQAHFAHLLELGVTVLEIMPIAEFPGRFNWGYDGVNFYAPYHGYGDYDALKRFVDAAHQYGLAVILDVVYNHLGPDGNYLGKYSPCYFTDRYCNEWGAAINYDGEHCEPVREFHIANACYWIDEFHLDGLRLDATQSIHDSGPRHVLAELSQRARVAAGSRRIILIAENEPQQVHCLAPIERGGHGLDAMWNDDFHHSARVA
ncbi:MAG TPA: alpha-amylase family glycosyl hydrolase, partial [Spongiibacteraceae bacterium]